MSIKIIYAESEPTGFKSAKAFACFDENTIVDAEMEFVIHLFIISFIEMFILGLT